MKVFEPTGTIPWSAHPTDHDFVRKVINELDRLPLKEKVHFPLPNRTSKYADIECVLGYNKDDYAYGEFTFLLREHELQMAHTCIVTTRVENAQIQMNLQVRPNRKLRDAGHKSMNLLIKGPKEMALAICRNYFPGSVGRKVIEVSVKKKKA